MGKQKQREKIEKRKLKLPDIKRLLLGSPGGGQTDGGNPYPNGTQSVIPIKGIDQGIVIREDGKYICILEILPICFHLKNEMERQNIIYYFASYLKIAPPNLQILIRTQRSNIDDYCANLESCYNNEVNENCQEMIYGNAELVNHLAENETVTHNLYLIFEYAGTAVDFPQIVKEMSEQVQTACQYLDYCGLEIRRAEDPSTFALKTLYSILNKRTAGNINLDSLPDQLMPVYGAPEISVEEPEGFLSLQDLLAPTEIDATHKEYILVDGVYHSYLYLSGYGYPTQLGLAWLSPLVEAGDGISFSFYLNKKRKDQILPKVSKTTMLNRSRMQDVGETRTDYEELDDAISSGFYIKNQMNREGEDFYYMNTLIEITAEDLETLRKRVSQVETLCGALDFIVRRADYKQEQCFQSMLPLCRLDTDIERRSRRNVLTTGAAGAFPFTSYELCDNNGIFLGINLYNNSVTILDLYNTELYSNGNFVIFGMSGAGKTFSLLLIAMRLRMQGVKVIIIAPEKGHEYRAAAEAIGGKYIRIAPGSQDCINVMAIRRTTLDIDAESERGREGRNDSVLLDKINRLHIYFSLLCPDMTASERYHLDTALTECYRDYGITRDNGSLLKRDGAFKPMPDLAALVPYLQKIDALQELTMAVQRIVRAGLGGQTSVDLSAKFVVLDVTDIGQEWLPLGIFTVSEYAQDEISLSRVSKSALIGDEIWKIAGVEGNEEATNFIIRMIKIIRGLGGVFGAATQNVVDCFALMGGKFGDALLGNARLKLLLQMEEAEALKLQEKLGLTDEETAQLTRYDRGQGLLIAGKNRVSIEIRASQTEYDLITTDPSDLKQRADLSTR